MSSSRLGTSKPVVVLFGPLSPSLSQSSLTTLRATILGSPQHAWLEQALASLPSHYRSLVTECPHLHDKASEAQIVELAAWLHTGHLSLDRQHLSNSILAPLVVISQLVQYRAFLDSQDAFQEQLMVGETVGFCIGLLSAFAVSLAHGSPEIVFAQNAGVALRLAMLTGCIVDRQHSQDARGRSKTFSVAWKRDDSRDGRKDLDRILAKFPDVSSCWRRREMHEPASLNPSDISILTVHSIQAYVSVIYDTTRVSLTTTVSILEPLQHALQNAGFAITELGLSGRFHSKSDHHKVFESILEFCDENPAFTFPSSSLGIPSRPNRGDIMSGNQTSLHKTALQSILLQRCDWYDIVSGLKTSTLSSSTSFVSFGERCIPASLLSGFSGRITYFDDTTAPMLRSNPNDVAVIGVSINVAGASSITEFWDLLVSGKSQHQLVSEDKFTFETTFRENDPKRKWYGNFIDGVEDFDHKFFKKTPRESTGMDPQQRLLLQCAYQAVEMSGYFNDNNDADLEAQAADQENIGCYIGMCGNDYVANTSHHAPNAFTATGTLRSFVAGKLSHYFGWLGPSLTLDTACSASAVAIHTACRAILSGEVTAALAGGTNTISEPGVYQNLAGASFLSPTGPCKPFDARADGYCRGEAVSAVFLKSLAQARKDGDVIIGVISGTAVAQNSNCTPIVVPNAPSLSTLFKSVLKTAKLDAQDVSVVEAHGTGTPVGDPAEYAAIRGVFGQEDGNGIKRPIPLQLGSVKGLVGHTEGSSGVVSLVKVLCMLHEAAIPPQASHSVMNPAIGANKSDGIHIATQLKPWSANFKSALINNYGASGSNASMVVSQAPKIRLETTANGQAGQDDGDLRYPFWFAGLDDRSIRTYTAKLRDHLKKRPHIRMADLAFNISRQSNRTLPRALLLSARSVSNLVDKLIDLDNTATASIDIPPSRPVIMCFGGQLSTTINLDRTVYESTVSLRQYMDRCNAMAITLGSGSIYPAVFQSSPITDIVLLQTALFAVQYSTAQCWIASGVKPVAVMGHSFGELTAMCISGVLELKDALTLIIRRATLIRDSWSTEKGSMLVVEGTEDEVSKVLADIDQSLDASIACYNAPRCYTIAGSLHAIDVVVNTISEKHAGLRAKRLGVSHAFHSSLVAPLRPQLQQIGKELTFHSPTIPIERSIDIKKSSEIFDEDFVADHLQNPVCFSHAVNRLAKKYPSAIWLEAGSNATITSMASKAINMPSAPHHYQAVNLSGARGLQNLIDATLALWKVGLHVTYWGHSRAQTEHYNAILLPPYQFEKKRHWLELKAPPKLTATVREDKEDLPEKLYTFTGYQDTKQCLARFRINTMIPMYQNIIAGHTIAGVASICPATVQIDVVIEAVKSLSKHLTADGIQPQIRSMVNLVPVCVDASRSVWLDAEALDPSRTAWSWKWTSTGPSGTMPTTHVQGEIQFRRSNDPHYQSEFSRYERLVSHRRCMKILHHDNPDEVLQGQRSIYRVFSPVVNYSPLYFGLQKLVGLGSESAGRVVKKHSGDSWLDAFLSDAFCQVAGIWVNCMAEESEKDMWIANAIEQWVRAPTITEAQTRSIDKWHVFGQHSRSADGNSILSDVFVFDAATGGLTEAILGIQYAKVSRVSMGKLLSRLTRDDAGAMQAPVSKSVPPVLMASAEFPTLPPTPSADLKTPKETVQQPQDTPSDIVKRLKAILADISGLEVDEIKSNVELADIGVDSLMGMEMAREIESEFKCALPQDELVHVTNFPELLQCLESALGLTTGSPDTTSSSSHASSSGDAYEDTVGSITPFSVLDEGNEGSSFPFDLELPQTAATKAFGESKLETDHLMEKYGALGYLRTIAPQQDQLCVTLIIEAFVDLGCNLSAATPGAELSFIPHAGEQKKFAQYLYTVLETSRIVDLDDGKIIRTHVPITTKPSSDLLRELLDKYPEHACCNELAYYTGSQLAGILTGEKDGIKLIFGTERGRELVGAVYADFPLNKLYYDQMGDFLRRLAQSTSRDTQQGPLKILEMGAGTGGTTNNLLPLLASLGVNIEYTFTDLAPSFVAAARKRYKQYSFMKFRTHDIEKEPAEDLLQSQHVVIASNAVHATRSLPVSTANIRKMLRPDGVLLLLEMTEPMYWCDIIFGVFEGWWLFEDGRQHAVAPPETWEKVLHSAGYAHVDWSDGHAEEVKCERLIMATATGKQLERLPIPPKPVQKEVCKIPILIDRFAN
jgi:acyl transferase domain-containing protein/acyl carrier protein/SAM-dependent methyltransferase